MAKQSMPRLRERYEREIVPALMQEFKFDNVMRAPSPVVVLPFSHLTPPLYPLPEPRADEYSQHRP